MISNDLVYPQIRYRSAWILVYMYLHLMVLDRGRYIVCHLHFF